MSTSFSVKFYLILAMMLSFGSVEAQHNASDQVSSANWDIIGTLDFKVVNEQKVYPVFSSEVKAISNKSFELEGYLIPIKEGLKHTRFLLSPLPVNQCFYCGQNGVPVMVLVQASDPVAFTYRRIKVKGVVKLYRGNMVDYPPISMVQATVTR